MNITRTLSVAAVIAAAGATANAQVSVDGSRDAAYGSSIANQISSVIEIITGNPLEFSGVWDNSNVGGVGPIGTGSFTNFRASDSAPAGVTTGFELVISLDEIEDDGNAATPIRIGGFLSKGITGNRGFISNQVIGGIDSDPLDDATKQPLGDPGDVTVDFSTIGGDQFIEAATGTAAAVIDGQLDTAAGTYPSTPQWVNPDLATTLGNNTLSDVASANGSEINAIYAYEDGTNLYVFVAGNVATEPDFVDVITLFIDADPGLGQNVIESDGTGGGFGFLAEFNDLAFDTNFTPNYLVTLNSGLSDDDGDPMTPDVLTSFVDTIAFSSSITPTGSGFFSGPAGTLLDSSVGAVPNGGSAQVFLDNSNTGGVSFADLAGAFDTDPAAVLTGFEGKIALDGIGYDGDSEINFVGWITGGDFGFASNQVIGSLPAGAGNLGTPAVDFSAIAGDQFATLSGINPASLPVANANLDGTADEALYQTLWTNTTPPGAGVGTGFGNNTDSTFELAGGSELNGFRAYVAQDPDNNNEPTLFFHVAGNLENNNNKFVLLIDSEDSTGQNEIRNDNFDIEFNNFNNNVGGDPMTPGTGYVLDTGITADFVITYGADGTQRFASGAQLLDMGGGFGGNFFGELLGTSAASGTLESREGFGDNDDPDTVVANGSELNNLSAYLDDNNFTPGSATDYLFLFIGGNLETNLNNIEIFIDTDSGTGQPTLVFDDPDDPADFGNPDVDFGALQRMGGPFDDDMDPLTADQPGFTFDAGFEAEYYYSFRGNAAGEFFGNFARLARVLPEDPNSPGDPDPGVGINLGTYDITSGATASGGDRGSEPTLFALNNSNVAGVEGDVDQFGSTAGAASVATGFEIGIDLSDINYDPTNGDTLKVTVFINGNGHSFVSNQFLGGACTDELGEPRLVDLSAIDGDQFVELVPAATPFNNRMTNSAGTADCIEPPACQDCPDVNGDGAVTPLDISAVLGAFGQSGLPAGTGGDTNCDGNVTPLDISNVLGAFGQSGLTCSNVTP